MKTLRLSLCHRSLSSSSLSYVNKTLFQARGIIPLEVSGFTLKERRRGGQSNEQQPFFQRCQQRRCFDILRDDVRSISQPGPKKKRSSKKIDKIKSNNPSYRFIDRVRLRVSGGSGGKGSSSRSHVSGRKFRPDGGHGGNGGSVIIAADPSQQTLNKSNPHLEAKKGSNGGPQQRAGRNGENLVVHVPAGVVVKRVLEFDEEWDEVNKVALQPIRDDDDDDSNRGYDEDSDYESGTEGEDENDYDCGTDNSEFDDSDTDDSEAASVEEVEMLTRGLEIDVTPEELSTSTNSLETAATKDRRTVVVADLDMPGSYAMVARGGRGGYGSILFASQHGYIPDQTILSKNATPEPGEVAFLELELKLIADLGLVGFPNAGKSSLLRAMSRARPQVASYPFTTLHPMVGCIDYHDGFQVRVADIPGLVRGASRGKGRGHDFLRHIERNKALMYIVDSAGVDHRDPIEDLYVLADELASYGDGSLLNRRSIIVANKVDLLARERVPELMGSIEEAAKEIGIHYCEDSDGGNNIIGISAGVSGEGLAALSRAIRNVVSKSDQDRNNAFEHTVIEQVSNG